MSDKDVQRATKDRREREVGSLLSRQNNVLRVIIQTEDAGQYERCLNTYVELEKELTKLLQDYRTGRKQ